MFIKSVIKNPDRTHASFPQVYNYRQSRFHLFYRYNSEKITMFPSLSLEFFLASGLRPLRLSWIGLKPEVRLSFQCPTMSVETQGLGPSTSALLGHKQGTASEVGHPRHKPEAIWVTSTAIPPHQPLSWCRFICIFGSPTCLEKQWFYNMPDLSLF